MAVEIRRVVKSSPIMMRAAAPAFRMKSVVMAQVPMKGSFPALSGKSHLEAVRFLSLAEFDDWRAGRSKQIASWEAEDDSVKAPGTVAFKVPGYCAMCDLSVDFRVTAEWGIEDAAGEVQPNWREQLLCPHCHMRNRVRAAFHLAIQDFGMSTGATIYISEQFGSGYRWLRGRFQNVKGSEYILPGKPSGGRWLGINHEDVQALSLPSGAFDYVLSFDVLEHVPDPMAAFLSFARVLRPGGRLVLTVPFTIDKFDTTTRAVMHDDGQIEHLLPIEVHGNPSDPVHGALCYRHFGWDTLDRLVEAGFAEASVHVYHNRGLGYLGRTQSIISALRA